MKNTGQNNFEMLHSADAVYQTIESATEPAAAEKAVDGNEMVCGVQCSPKGEETAAFLVSEEAFDMVNEIPGFAVERLTAGTPVCISKVHRFGTDAMLLSHFCGVHREEAACDLGTGCGIIPLRWHDAGHQGRCVALEIQSEGTALLCEALRLGNITHIKAVCGDMRSTELPELARESFDLVSCNPPYFTGGFVSQKPGRGVIRHQLQADSRDVCCCAARILKDRGRLCICQRPFALGRVMADFAAAGLQPKRLRFVRQRADSIPWLFLLDGRKNGGDGLTLLPDLVMEAPQGGFSSEVLQIYGKAVQP